EGEQEAIRGRNQDRSVGEEGLARRGRAELDGPELPTAALEDAELPVARAHGEFAAERVAGGRRLLARRILQQAPLDHSPHRGDLHHRAAGLRRLSPWRSERPRGVGCDGDGEGEGEEEEEAEDASPTLSPRR